MSHFIDRLKFFSQVKETFADGHGAVVNEDRKWENGYRSRWQHDKIVRSTHGVNCTGSCSWKIYVKNGLITWETQQTDYPRTRPDLPNHEPRGCPLVLVIRGMSIRHNGLYKATKAIMSSKHEGLSFFSSSFMPRDSNWNTSG